MNDFQYYHVSQLLEKMSSKPIIKIIERVANEKKLSPTLEMVKEKMGAQAYLTPFDFAIDIRLLLSNVKNADDQRIENVVRDVEQWFDRKMNSLPRNQDDLYAKQLAKAKKRFIRVRQAMSLTAFQIDHACVSQNPAKQIKKPLRLVTLSMLGELSQLLEGQNDPTILAHVALILRKHSPNFRVQETVRLTSSDLTYQCAEELINYLNTVTSPSRSEMSTQESSQNLNSLADSQSTSETVTQSTSIDTFDNQNSSSDEKM